MMGQLIKGLGADHVLARVLQQGLGEVREPLDFGMALEAAPAETWLPRETLAVASGLTHWITENAKSTRAFLKRVNEQHPLAGMQPAQLGERVGMMVDADIPERVLLVIDHIHRCR